MFIVLAVIGDDDRCDRNRSGARDGYLDGFVGITTCSTMRTTADGVGCSEATGVTRRTAPVNDSRGC